MVMNKHPYSVRLDDEVWDYLVNQVGQGSLTRGITKVYEYHRDCHESKKSPDLERLEQQLMDVEKDIIFLKAQKNLGPKIKEEIKDLEDLLKKARETKLVSMKVGHNRNVLLKLMAN